MTGSQKAIKVISIIVIIISILSIVAGGVSCAGGMAGVAASNGAPAGQQKLYALGAGALLVLGAGAVIGGAIDLIVGILGLRGAKNPDKIMSFFVISIIGVIFAALNLIGCFTSGQIDGTSVASAIVQLILMVICVVLANNVRKMR